MGGNLDSAESLRGKLYSTSTSFFMHMLSHWRWPCGSVFPSAEQDFAGVVEELASVAWGYGYCGLFFLRGWTVVFVEDFRWELGWRSSIISIRLFARRNICPEGRSPLGFFSQKKGEAICVRFWSFCKRRWGGARSDDWICGRKEDIRGLFNRIHAFPGGFAGRALGVQVNSSRRKCKKKSRSVYIGIDRRTVLRRTVSTNFGR